MAHEREGLVGLAVCGALAAVWTSLGAFKSETR